ncbi:MAG: hypothetical protein JWP91_2369 [Fibrobacteres bacterium]|nr:hypothetical protein [Fibrobacterota bacterium]
MPGGYCKDGPARGGFGQNALLGDFHGQKAGERPGRGRIGPSENAYWRLLSGENLYSDLMIEAECASRQGAGAGRDGHGQEQDQKRQEPESPHAHPTFKPGKITGDPATI